VHAGGGPIPADVARKLADRLSQPSLTAREIQILQLVAEGMRNKELAGTLGISEQTAQGHIKNILAKLKVNDRTAAVTVGLRRGIIRITDP
jgi:DNA-binding NarL/FixJ family response regulator